MRPKKRRALQAGLCFAVGCLAGGALSPWVTTGSKASIAATVVVVLGLSVLVVAPRLSSRVRQALYLAVSGLAFASSTNFFVGHFASPEHPSDFSHYVLGARFVDELRYTGLYDCALAAAVEQRMPIDGWQVRDLRTYAISSAASRLEQAEACRGRFDEARWVEFTDDLNELQRRSKGTLLPAMLVDHGFNAPPVWLLLASPLIIAGPAHWLTWLDPLLILVAAAVLFRAFGGRTLMVVMLVWGCHVPNRFDWAGGSFLRNDWWVALAVGLAFLRFRRDRLAGAAFAYAALLRVFPALVLVAAVGAALLPGRDRKRAGRLLLGAGIATLVLCGAAAGQHDWRLFTESFENLRTHGSAWSYNQMGLQPALAVASDARLEKISEPDPAMLFESWSALRAQVHERVRGLTWVLRLAALGLWVAVARRGRLGSAAATSVGLIPFAATLSCYYEAVLAFLAVGTRVSRAAAMVLVAGLLVGRLVPAPSMRMDDYFDAQSCIDLVMIVAVFLARLWGARRFTVRQFF